ncbi:MAG: hypothetical protein ACI4R9_06845 [Kiritimatiellia bacterium]
MQTTKWAEHGRFCVEAAAIPDDHRSSWLWIDTNGMTFRYHLRYGGGYGTPMAKA